MEILANIITYLGDDVNDADSPVLLILINRAIRKVCAKRYPFGYTNEEKKAAVEKYWDMVFDAAIYYWAKQGADFQNSSSENGISRSYMSEDELYFDIVPVVKIM